MFQNNFLLMSWCMLLNEKMLSILLASAPIRAIPNQIRTRRPWIGFWYIWIELQGCTNSDRLKLSLELNFEGRTDWNGLEKCLRLILNLLKFRGAVGFKTFLGLISYLFVLYFRQTSWFTRILFQAGTRIQTS